jgi:NAD(P)H-dependent FMN reductase
MFHDGGMQAATNGPTRLGVVLGSTRPGRRAEAVASWFMDVGCAHLQPCRGHASLELLDLADFDLPVLDEPKAAVFGDYAQVHTRRWAAAVEACDGFVFVTPEYNRSLPGALKNAIDYLFAEWNDKAAGFVGYGVVGGVRALEHLRRVLGEVRVASVRTAVALSLQDDLPGGLVRPRPHQVEQAHRMLDEVLTWTGALQVVRRR